MYSTNLHIAEGDGTYIWDDTKPVGTAFGHEHIEKDEDGNVTDVGPATQTAKDNALLWSLAPEMVELLREVYHEFWTGDRGLWYRRVAELLETFPATPPASVAQNG